MIGIYAFKECSGLKSVTLQDGVTSIGIYAFQDCKNLTSITIQNGSIGDWAFYGCSGLESLILQDGVTSIGKFAFDNCDGLTEIVIPSSVTSLGYAAFSYCSNLKSVVFKSLPLINDDGAFGALKLENVILDLTDSEKPYIGFPLRGYPSGGFTEAHYHRTLEKGKWGTIVLPFMPTDGSDGLEFYELKEMAIGGESGSLTFTKVDAPVAGMPYLVKNVSDCKTEFTLTASNNPAVTVNATNQTADGFALKGNFQQTSLNTTENKNDNLYYLKDNEFWHATGKINIAPFRAYIESDGSSQVNSFMLVIEDDDVTAIPGILDEDGTIDETEAIYDLSGRRLAAPVKGQINIIRTKSGKTIKRLF